MKLSTVHSVLVVALFLVQVVLKGTCFESKITNLIRKANITELGCDGQSTSLVCGSEEGIKIRSVFWGRKDTTTCPSQDPKKTTKQLCKTKDPTYPLKKVKTLCDGKALCSLDASETYFEAPLCPKVAKYLKVVYDCRVMSGMGAR